MALLSRECVQFEASKSWMDLSHASLWSSYGAKMPYSYLAFWIAARTGKSFHDRERPSLHKDVSEFPNPAFLPLPHGFFCLQSEEGTGSILSHKVGLDGAAILAPSCPVRAVVRTEEIPFSSLCSLTGHTLIQSAQRLLSLTISTPLDHCNRSHRPDFGTALSVHDQTMATSSALSELGRGEREEVRSSRRLHIEPFSTRGTGRGEAEVRARGDPTASLE
jgi:hypothetical protein